MRYGLIGEKLGHSQSPLLHGLLGDADYMLCPIAPDALDAFLTRRDFLGINVTIPYKRAVIPYLTAMGETAAAIGSVNTVVRREDGTLFGDNTDAFGFAKMAEQAGIAFAGRKVLVLGSGGTGLTACHVVRAAGGNAVVISRHGEEDYAHLARHGDAEIIVNATPVGMYPNVDAAPVDLAAFPRLCGVLDVVYNPRRTRLLQQAEAMGIPHAGGLSMLLWQAVRARALFDGHEPAPEAVANAMATLRRDIGNLVVIGMPGSGKTAIGKRCAQQLGLSVMDTDAEIERRAGKTIPQIFQEEGEAAFRALEAEVIAALGGGTGLLLTTGGGAVLREDNRFHLRMNSTVVRITRPVELLHTEGRPLSKSVETLRAMEAAREPYYQACADFTVANQTTKAACVRAILEGYDEAVRHQRA